ncbi:hypothetical protein D3C87_775990 [compost metagenome]
MAGLLKHKFNVMFGLSAAYYCINFITKGYGYKFRRGIFQPIKTIRVYRASVTKLEQKKGLRLADHSLS